MFKNGHTFNAIVDFKHRSQRIDKRLSHNHKGCRTNMRDRQGERSKLVAGEVLSGTNYAEQMICVMCLETYPRDLFQNKSVSSTIRHNNGMNIRCRYCVDNIKTKGYKPNAFIATDFEDTNIYIKEDEDEDEDEDNETEYDETEDEDDEPEDDEDEDDEYFKVETILDHKIRKSDLFVLVKWEGYSSKHNSWEPCRNLKHTTEFKKYFKMLKSVK
jgi:hypothetical protein